MNIQKSWTNFLLYWHGHRARKNRDWILNPIMMFVYGAASGILMNWIKKG
jgi:hypothetical protein